jgi:hypothetical protein
MSKETNHHHDESHHIDLVAEATAQAAAGATTDVHHNATYGNSDITDGRSPDPDLAQGESD